MKKFLQPVLIPILMSLWLLTLAISTACMPLQTTETQIPVTFSGGYETDPNDNGRPVVLVAAALGVTPEVFRTAFSGVTPAQDGNPSAEQAQLNKAALLKVLEPYGVTNERLDEVSDYYRYQPQSGERWQSTPAQAYAVMADSKIERIVVTEPGSGYTTAPVATVAGMEDLQLEVTLQFGPDLATNGSVSAIHVISASEPATSQ